MDLHRLHTVFGSTSHCYHMINNLTDHLGSIVKQTYVAKLQKVPPFSGA
jgi:hypothetical protein